jgi:hypothetical protein
MALVNWVAALYGAVGSIVIRLSAFINFFPLNSQAFEMRDGSPRFVDFELEASSVAGRLRNGKTAKEVGD